MPQDLPQSLSSNLPPGLTAHSGDNQGLYETILDSIPAMVWMARPDRSYHYFNKAWLDFTGRTFAEELGKGWTAGVHPEDFDRGLQIYRRAFDAREGFEMVYRLRRHDGEYRWLMDRGQPHYLIDGTFAGYTGSCFDVHDKVLAEQRLKDSEERMGLALYGMNDGLWDYDLVQNRIYYAPRYKKMLGYEGDEFESTVENWQQHLHPEDKDAAIRALDNYLNGRKADYNNQFRMRHKDGSYRWILSRARGVRDTNGRMIRIVGGHTDISEQKMLERELREAYGRAEAASAAKTEFLTNMSHEIRTPMNAIVGLSHILQGTPLDEKQQQFVSTLQGSANALLSLLNDMLDISKIEHNMVQLEQIPFDLHMLTEQAVHLLSVRAAEKNLALNLHYETKMRYFSGDPLRLRQILLNLIGNAVKFTDAGRIDVTISAREMVAGMHKVTLKVSDTGIGIPPEKLCLVFDKFTQADNSTTRKYGGSGLGLTICRGLAERMGGNIHVASEPEKGSVFTVNLPLAPVTTGVVDINAPEEKSPARAKQKACVLLVEDYQPNVLVATTLLEQFGYDYAVAYNGLEALEKLRNGEFFAVLMDVQMQGLDGLETTRRWRAQEFEAGRARLPVIAMTAHALAGDRDKCLEAGMDDYLAKPFNPDELLQKLQHWENTPIAVAA